MIVTGRLFCQMRTGGKIVCFSGACWPRGAQFAVAGFAIFISFVPPGLAHKMLHHQFGFREPVVFAFL
jgi:hypothetical protein